MSGFVDEAQVHARGGDGGAGAVSFRREAHVDRGGPDGGDGGRGGDVWLEADANLASLLGFRDHPFRRARDGAHGSGKRRHGQDGGDLVVRVPLGTIVRGGGGSALCDLSTPGARWLASRGGRGGRGNARFLSNARRAPAFAEQGERGEEQWLDLELKLIADVAIVGFPNAGKSTLISTISAARPKIGAYPFTTLEPHLGVARVGSGHDEVEIVVADVPGLVEGAADGKGLGHRFLRHVERARILVVLVDLGPLATETPQRQLEVLLNELETYRPELLERPRLVVGSKTDVAGGPDRATPGSLALDMAISAATGAHVEELLVRLARLVLEDRSRRGEDWVVRATASGAASSPEIVVHRPVPEGISVERLGAHAWLVLGRDALHAVRLSDLTDDAALALVVRRLRRLGVDRALQRAGAVDGDEVTVGETSFTWFRDGPPETQGGDRPGRDETPRRRRRTP